MQLNNIANIIELQGAVVVGINCEVYGEIVLHIEPKEYKQNCPCCKSSQTVRNGQDGYRRIRHLPIAEKKCILSVPKIRLKCNSCNATYAYQYDFVDGKQRYTKAYKSRIYKTAVGSTVQHTADITETPYSTAERFFKEMVLRLAPKTEYAAQKLAHESQKLILGFDDFAIRKGHTYNTGIHDLRGESLLCVIKGRKLDDLRNYMQNHPQMASLKPFAIVMDLAKNYHSFAAEFFPEAIRVADRFHVNAYMIEALNEIRRRVSKNLAPQARMNLKRYKTLINKRRDCLSKEEQTILHLLLLYSNDLRAAYELKEELITWYDCSFSYLSAQVAYKRWCAKAHALNIYEIQKALKTFLNWQVEIVNYHRCRFTNGVVEGRNGKIKSLQRRRFFLQNRTFYESLIMLECNPEIAQIEFTRLNS